MNMSQPNSIQKNGVIPGRLSILFIQLAIIVIFIDNLRNLMAFEVFVTSVFYIIKSNIKKYSLISWRLGIPAFFGLFLGFIPIIQQAVKAEDFNRFENLDVTLYVSTFAMFVFIFGVKYTEGLISKINSKGVRTKISDFISMPDRPAFVLALTVIGAYATYWSFKNGYWGLIATMEAPTNPLTGLFSALSTSLMIAHIISWQNILKTTYKKNLMWKFIGFISLLFLTLAGLFSASKGTLLTPMIVILLIYYVNNKRIPWFGLGFILLLFGLFILPFISWLRFSEDLSTVSRTDLLTHTYHFLVRGEWSSSQPMELTALQSVGRSLLTSFNTVINKTGAAVGFLMGKSYIAGFQAFVPRFIVGDKIPNSTNWIAQYYGITGESDFITNVSFTSIGEMYMNFGLFGVAIGMFFNAFLAVLVDTYIIKKGESWLAIMMVLNISWQESFLGQTLLPFVKNMILVWILFVLIKLLLPRSRTSPALPKFLSFR